MIIRNLFKGPYTHLAFSLQDVDRTCEYVMALRHLATELSEFFNLQTEPQISEHEDHTGYYIVVSFINGEEAFNYIDLLIDAMSDNELEIDLEHLQLFTHDFLAYQRFNNAKQEMLSNEVFNLIEDIVDSAIPDRILDIESHVVYNSLDKMRPVIQAIVNKLELNGIEIGDEINAIVKDTIH